MADVLRGLRSSFQEEKRKGKLMQWAKHLYLSDKTAANKEKIKNKAEKGVGMVSVYFIALASNPDNLFDIFHAAYLKQNALYRRNPFIVGIASGYEEAIELVQRIVEDIYRETGGFRVTRDLVSDRRTRCCRYCC